MTFLKRIGFSTRRVRPVGTTLEKGSIEKRSVVGRKIAVKVGIFLTLLLVTLAVFPRGQVYKYTVLVNDVWQRPDLLAPFSFPIQKAREDILAAYNQIRIDTPPVFRDNGATLEIISAERDTLSAELDYIFGIYASFRGNQSRGRLDESRADSISFLEARDRSQVALTEQQWDRLLDSFASTVPGLSTRSRSSSLERLDHQLLGEVWNSCLQLIGRGVTDVPRDSIYSDQIAVRNDATRRQKLEESIDYYGFREAYQVAQNSFRNTHLTDPDASTIATVFFSIIFRPSYLYDRAATEQQWRDREAAVSPNEDLVRENEVIVRQGDVITSEIHRKLLSFEHQQNDRSGNRLSWEQILGHLILSVTTYLIFFLYLYLLRRPLFDDNRMVFLISMLFLVIVSIYGVALRSALVDMYVVPVAMVAILLTVIFDSRVAMFGTLSLALIGGHLLNYDFAYTFATVFAGTLGIFSVRDIRNRGQFFSSAGIVFVGYLSVLFATFLLQNKPVDRFTSELIFTAVNSVLVLLAYPMLWIFERTFDITTDLTLLELSDTNRPALKELSMRAPGTFNHVLQVANLAEAGATAIGANALLTRVGALYHDVGKMTKPEYFVENQRAATNPHDQLKPRMSALIIANHVKEGLDIGRSYKLPKRVLDFIPMHHGTTRIEYFYQRALDRHKDGEPDILEADFRYPGPRPNTVETSLLMLADSVEAAARALDNPSHKRLESLIDFIFETRMEDGQLDESGLTFADLNVVKDTFLKVLRGFFHARVKYPGDDENSEPQPAGSSEDRVGSSKSSGNQLSESLD